MPDRHARIVAAPITLLIPGAGPPPTKIASLLFSSMLRIGKLFGPGASAKRRNSAVTARDSPREPLLLRLKKIRQSIAKLRRRRPSLVGQPRQMCHTHLEPVPVLV